MKIRIAVLIVVIFCVVSSTAYAYFVNGNDLYKWWQVAKTKITNISDSPDAFLYYGYVIGAADAFAVKYFNIPEGVTQGQIQDIVGKYLETHPENRHLDASTIVLVALLEVYPKKEDLPSQKSDINWAAVLGLEKANSTTETIWGILFILSVVLLVVFGKKRSAVWGGLIPGTIVGLIIGLIGGHGFNLIFIAKGAIVGILLGFLAELLGKASDLIKRKSR